MPTKYFLHYYLIKILENFNTWGGKKTAWIYSYLFLPHVFWQMHF